MNKKNDVTNKIDGIRKSKVRAFQRRTKVTELAMQSLIKNGAFFQTPQDGFYFHGPSKQLFPLEQHSRGLAAFIEKQFGLNEAERGEYQHLLAALANHAYRDGQKTCIYRLAHYDSISKTLYVSRFDGNIYRLDGKCIELVPNGTDKVFFWDDPQWEKYEVTEAPKDVGAFERTILRPVNFATDQVLRPDEQRWLFRVWLLAQFFDTLHPTKPIALVTWEKVLAKPQL